MHWCSGAVVLGVVVGCGSVPSDGSSGLGGEQPGAGSGGGDLGGPGADGSGADGAGAGESGGAPGSSGAPAGTGGAPTLPIDCSGITSAGYELCASSDTTCETVYTDSAGCDAVCEAAGLACSGALENVDDACAADETLPPLPCDSEHQSDYCICVAGEGGGTGGASGTGGMDGAGGTDPGPEGDLSLADPVPGFASQAGGTTGGGTNLANAVTVTNMTDLKAAASGSAAKIVFVEPGTYSGTLSIGANKTIIGTGPGVRINGNVSISGSSVSNVIVRNISVRGLPCSTYDECRAGSDAVYIGNGAHHVWLDHLDISDGQDGNCDVTQGGDYVTVSWTKFYYTYNKEHRFSNLIAGSDDEPNSVGKLRITYMNSWWGERVDSRQPRGRFGNVHMLNNYHNTGGGQIHGVGKDMALIAENSVYSENRSIWTDMGSPRGWKGVGNIGTGSNLNATQGTVFTIPYGYTPLPASSVVAAVTSSACGAGNTCTFAR